MTPDNLVIQSAGTNTPLDRDKLKIASFRTKEGVWADFTTAANKIGLTATDVIKAAMEQFIAGEYIPSINTGTYTAVSTQSGLTRDEIQELIDTAINTSVSTEIIEANVMTVISTLSLPSVDSVNTAINTVLVPLRCEIADVQNLDSSLRGEVEALGELVSELETYTQSQFKAVREEVKKPLAIAR